LKPYYEDPNFTIYNCDCREILPELPKVDLVLTDPPYGMNFQSNFRIEKHEKIRNDDSLPIELISDIYLKPTHAAYIFCRWDNLWEMPTPKSCLVWVKNNWSMGDLNHEHGRQYEMICFYPNYKHKFIKRIPDVLIENRTGNELHPTQKPVGLFKQLIECNEGVTILDPFMGSGTTLRAAKDPNRKAIGIEIEEKYCEIAVNRLKQQVLDL